MNRFHYFIALVILACTSLTVSAVNDVERLRSRSELKKALAEKVTKQRHMAPVSRVSEAVVELPWFENFEDESTFDSFIVIDSNDDFVSWEWSDGVAQYFSLFADDVADDWLITPGFRMEAGKNYEISFRARSFDESSPEEFSAWLGASPDAESMTIEVVEKTVVAQYNALDFNVTVKVPVDGVYYLGIHCTSDPTDGFELDIDDISVKEGAVEAAPDAVTDLAIVADPEGALKATISFRTPVLTTAGTSLSSLSKVEIYRDDTNLIKTFENPGVGEELIYVDENPSNGDNHYTVIPYNETGAGKSTKLSLFVGEDIPSVPQNITLSVVASDVIITWEDLPLGWNGHYVNTSNLRYDIWESVDGINLVEVAKGVEGNSYTIAGRAEQGVQRQYIYVMRAVSSAGEGSRGHSNSVILGKSLDLPFEESFAEQKLHSSWFLSSKDTKASAVTDMENQDGDGGSIKISGQADGVDIDLYSSKIWLKDVPEVHLYFWYRLPAGAKLSVGLAKDFNDIKIVEVEASDEWKAAHIDLTGVADMDYAQIIFRHVAGTSPCYIDNITLSSKTLGMDNVSFSSDKTVLERYNVDGMKVGEDYRGIVIERLSDGSVVKRVSR